MTDAVHAEGGAIAAQLWLRARSATFLTVAGKGQETISPSGIDVAGNRVGRALRIDELGALADVYVKAARNARDARFDAVEVRGGYGYLFDQFLWGTLIDAPTATAARSLHVRTPFPAEVVAAAWDAVGSGFPIIFRFSQWKNQPGVLVSANVVGVVHVTLTPPSTTIVCPVT